jgi:hypothetical protein
MNLDCLLRGRRDSSRRLGDRWDWTDRRHLGDSFAEQRVNGQFMSTF